MPGKNPTFREIKPIPQWSAKIAINVPYDEFIQTVLLAAAKLKHRYVGTLTRSKSGNVTSFTHTRFPRKKYGRPPTIKECQRAINYLAVQFSAKAKREVGKSGTSRIVLGLHKGQHATGARNKAPDYSITYVISKLGRGYGVSLAEVLSVRLEPNGKATRYSEPIVEIILPTTQKLLVYNLGDAMKQERFSAEDFISNGGWSYMVETRYCKEPDPA